MSKITLKFNEETEQVKLPTMMPSCIPFVALNKLTTKKEVLIRTPGDAFIFFREGCCLGSLEENSLWVDDNYEVLPNEKATVILKV